MRLFYGFREGWDGDLGIRFLFVLVFFGWVFMINLVEFFVIGCDIIVFYREMIDFFMVYIWFFIYYILG